MTGEILVVIFISVYFVPVIYHLPKLSEIAVGSFRSRRMSRVVYHLPPNFRIDAPRLTGMTERAKRPETSTKPLKRANGCRISFRPGNFPVERARRSSAIYITTGISGNF